MTDPTTELQDILKDYSLGELAGFERNERGFVNTAFAIETLLEGERHAYFLRKYKRGIREEELQFEHSLINHLVACGAPPAARVHVNRLGKTYLHRFEGPDDNQGVFYAIFDFLLGDDRYTWVGPRCTPPEIRSSAEVLAQFHHAAAGFTPQGRRSEPKILEMLPVIAANVALTPQRGKGTIFDDYLLANLDLVTRDVEHTRTRLNEPDAVTLPQCIIHCDYHPGNLKFTGEAVTGLFDFDWSKLDARTFDLGLGLWYFFASWEGDQDGCLRLEDVGLFVEAYQQALQGSTPLGPLSEAEQRYLPYMINAGSLYVLNWTIEDFYAKDVDPQEYMAFLRHSVEFSRWFDDPANRAALADTIHQAARG